MVLRRRSVGVPRPVAIAAVAVLVVGYVPLTGLDHLHLHIDHGVRLFHDHLHIGNHQHAHHHQNPAEPVKDTERDDRGEDRDPVSAVVSLGHPAQVRPPAVRIADSASPIAGRTVQPVVIPFVEPLHPSWDSRAPPC